MTDQVQDPSESKPASSFRVSDLLLCVLAVAIAAGLLKRHAEESAMAYRLKAHPPLSVWTRLVIGHALSSFGLVFGLARLTAAIRERKRAITFGTWIWSIIGLYLVLFVSASVAWAMANRLLRPILQESNPAGVSPGEIFSRVSLMTFNQACFDAFAWALAAIWIASALFRVGEGASEEAETPAPAVERHDIAVSVFTGLAIFGTIFQRMLESMGY
ncbi:hypothetical protein GC170_01070 [bacterium]|nr:hypothetical protein [bacterium]